MTITYEPDNVLKTLCRWKGSLWRAVIVDVVIWLLIYYAIMLVYQFGMSGDVQLRFEKVVYDWYKYLNVIPLMFLLGFYVNNVMGRYWRQFDAIWKPDSAMTYLQMLVRGVDETQTEKRRAIARWVVLAQVLAYRKISLPVRKRYPTMDYLSEMKLITDEERKIYESLKCENARWCISLLWAQDLIRHDFEHCNTVVGEPEILSAFLGELRDLRKNCIALFKADWINFPLIYSQMVGLVVYGYFALCLIGRQFVNDSSILGKDTINFYVPFFTIMQLVFCLGWYKTGTALLRPFGDDDDDLELNYFLDRTMSVAFGMADETYNSRAEPVDPDVLGSSSNLQYTKAVSYQASANQPMLLCPVKLNEKNKKNFESVERTNVYRAGKFERFF